MPARKVATTNDENVNNSTEVLAFSSKAEKAEVARKVLFTIDDEEFTIPEKLDPIQIRRFFNVTRLEGGLAGELALLGQAFGEDALKRFLDWDGLTEEIYDQITSRVVSALITGADGEGN